MWYPLKDFTVQEARRFLRGDFVRVVKRTKYLYIERKPKKSIGYGFFEPILLCLCWCDFLGALYCGDGKSISAGGIGNTKRSKKFIDEVLGALNPGYKKVSRDLIMVYRHGTVHAFAPAGTFNIRLSDKAQHLRKERARVIVSVEHLLDDLLGGTKYFAKNLRHVSTSLVPGTLGAFNKGRKELG
jgi:hypothetical protein